MPDVFNEDGDDVNGKSEQLNKKSLKRTEWKKKKKQQEEIVQNQRETHVRNLLIGDINAFFCRWGERTLYFHIGTG